MKITFAFLFIRLALGAMWIVSGGMKLRDLNYAVISVRNYKFPLFDVPPGDVLLGYGLPWLELVVGLLLIFGILTRACYLLSMAMFLMFLAAISYAKYHGLQIDCGCFGAGESPITAGHFIGLMVGIALVAALWWRGDSYLPKAAEETV